MNRKQRRAAVKLRISAGGNHASPADNSAARLFVEAENLQRQNKLEESARVYKRLLHLKPGHAQANNNLGAILHAQGRLREASTYFARSLRKKRSMSVGVLVPEMSEGYFTLVMNGVEEYLMAAKYFYLLASHYWQPSLLEEYPKMLLERSVDGILLVNTPTPTRIQVPLVSISGHEAVPGVTNIQLDHKQAARLALKHLADLGHRRVAFMKGQ